LKNDVTRSLLRIQQDRDIEAGRWSKREKEKEEDDEFVVNQ